MILDGDAIGRNVAEALLRRRAAVERHEHLAAGRKLEQVPDADARLRIGGLVERLQRHPLRIAGVLDRRRRPPPCRARGGADWRPGRTTWSAAGRRRGSAGPGAASSAARTGIRRRRPLHAIVAHVQLPRLPVGVRVGVGKEGVQLRRDPGAVAARVVPAVAGRTATGRSRPAPAADCSRRNSRRFPRRTAPTPAPRRETATCRVPSDVSKTSSSLACRLDRLTQFVLSMVFSCVLLSLRVRRLRVCSIASRGA